MPGWVLHTNWPISFLFKSSKCPYISYNDTIVIHFWPLAPKPSLLVSSSVFQMCQIIHECTAYTMWYIIYGEICTYINQRYSMFALVADSLSICLSDIAKTISQLPYCKIQIDTVESWLLNLSKLSSLIGRFVTLAECLFLGGDEILPLHTKWMKVIRKVMTMNQFLMAH